MSAKDKPVSQPATDKYRTGWDAIKWNKEPEQKEQNNEDRPEHTKAD